MSSVHGSIPSTRERIPQSGRSNIHSNDNPHESLGNGANLKRDSINSFHFRGMIACYNCIILNLYDNLFQLMHQQEHSDLVTLLFVLMKNQLFINQNR